MDNNKTRKRVELIINILIVLLVIIGVLLYREIKKLG